MTKGQRYNILLIINILLVLALAASVFFGVRQTNNLTTAKNEISHKQTAIQKQEEQLKEIEKENKKLQGEKSKLQSEKSKLQSENSKLQKTIKDLKAQKQKTEKPAATVNKKPVTVPQNAKPNSKVCYLTFDDGPTANTLKILKILDQYNVKATFFVIDTPQTKIQYVKQIHAAGHTIGLHSATHNYAKIYKSSSAYFADLKKISDKVKSLTGVESKVIRFPGGGSNTVSRNYKKGIMTYLTSEVTKKGYTYFDWNISSGDADAATVSTTKIVRNVLSGAKNASSACVLMHDAASKTTTVEALPKIIEGLKKQGYQFKPLTKDCYGYHHGVNN